MADIELDASLGDLREQIDGLRREADVGRRFRLLAEGIPQLVWSSFDEGQWHWAGPQWQAFTGQTAEQSLGRGWEDVIHPDDRAATNDAWAAAHDRQQFVADFRIRRASDGVYIWHQTRAVPLPGARVGNSQEWLGTATDIQDLKEADDRQNVLVAELQHRTRNLIAVVRSVAEKTVRGAVGLGDFAIDFRTRLAALARVQGLLSRSTANHDVTFGDLIRSEMSAHYAPNGCIALAGPDDVALPPRAVQTLALALHELATNAVKYGALSQSTGQLAIDWRLVAEDPRRLRVDWCETGVVMPSAVPVRRGYGRELIERALPYQLGAEVDYAFAGDGVRCTIVIPVA